MAAQSCPICRAPNPAQNEYCGACGAALNDSPLVVSAPHALQFNHALPPQQVKRIVATLALSLAAVLAEAGLRHLQGRLDTMPAPSLRRKRGNAETGLVIRPADNETAQGGNGRVITVISERVVEEKRWGRPARRIVERFAWRAEEKRL